MSTADDAWQEFNSSPSGEPRYGHSEQAAFMAGYRRALEDAADAIQAAIENPSDDTVDAYHFDGLDEAATICRDLAAGVGTKDGDDDA